MIKVLNTEIPEEVKIMLDKHSKESGLKKHKIVELALIMYIKKMESKK